MIGKQLLTSTYENLQGEENFPHLIFKDSNAFNNAKASFLNGEGIGATSLVGRALMTYEIPNGKEINDLEGQLKVSSAVYASYCFLKDLYKTDKAVALLQEA